MTTEVLTTQFAFTAFVFDRNVEGITHALSLVPAAPEGSTLNWLAGHLVVGRSGVLTRLGGDPLWTEEEARGYRRGDPKRPAAECHDFEWLAGRFRAAQEPIAAALGALDPERLQTLVPHPVRPGETMPLGLALGALIFHESYHVGQTGILRRLAGLPGAIA